MFGFPVAALVFILSTLLLTAMVTIKVVSTRSVGLAIRDLRTPIIIYIASLVQLAMVMKHYSAHYAIPGALLIGSCFIVLIGHLEQAGWSARRIGALAWAAIFCAGVLWLTREIPEAIAVDSNERSAVGSLREQFERALDGVDEPLLITTYGSRGEEAAISFGLSYAALDLGKLLKAGDRASLYYNASNGKFRDSSAGWLTRERIYEKMRSGVSVFYFGPVDAGPPGFEEKLLTRDNALNQELLLLQPPPATTGGQVELP